MPELTAFIATVKNLDLQLATINDLGSPLMLQAISDACIRYSQDYPRGQRSVTININVDDTEILLPSDCLLLSEENAYLLYFGSYPGKYDVPGAYPQRYLYYNNYYSSSPLSNTSDIPLNTSQRDFPTIPVSTSSTGRISIQLATPITTARSHTIRYDAYHTISDNPDTNTIKLSDRPKFRDLVLSYFYEARNRIAVQEGDFTSASGFEKLAGKHLAKYESDLIAMGGLC